MHKRCTESAGGPSCGSGSRESWVLAKWVQPGVGTDACMAALRANSKLCVV